MKNRGFSGKLSLEEKESLQRLATVCRGDILKMTTLAGSGHPGGSMSSIDLYLTVYKFANITPENFRMIDRDRVVVSHGHTSPGVYSALGRSGFFNIDDAIAYFRLAGSIYEGHIERMVNGVEWTTGNLGQGLSAACGMAIAGRANKLDYNIYVFMGDGEQQKGQISEARRFAVKYNLNNITAVVDYNRLQISGDIEKVMPQNIKDEYIADGWVVIEIDGHNFDEIYDAFVRAKSIDRPVLILANTTMGKGVSFIENIADYHGKPLSLEQLDLALKELGVENDVEKYAKKRKEFVYKKEEHTIFRYDTRVKKGVPKVYSADVKTDNRSAFGNAIADLIQLASISKDSTPIVTFDCDLAGSVKLDKVMKDFPENFIQSGIQEHHTAVAAGAASVNGVISVFADFGVFGVDETYNQQRLTDINDGNLKLVTTHVGIDVGEDGKTHQCIDYVGAMRNIPNFKVLVPADPNQTDRLVRYAVGEYGNFLVAMGRSKIQVITKDDGSVFFDEDYEYSYGKIDIIRDGKYPLITYGTMTNYALKVRKILLDKGIELAVINIASPLEFDILSLKKYIDSGYVFTYEDHLILSGVAATLSMKAMEQGISFKLKAFGPSNYAYSGKPDDIFKLLKLDPESVAKSILEVLK
jgi:transketolase